MNDKHKHLDMIQSVMSRLATNSFQIKGWSMLLVTALIALAAKGGDRALIYFAYFPALALWTLDGYYLWQERLFSEHYDHVRALPDDQIDFSMDTDRYRDDISGWGEVTVSRTLLVFHGTIAGMIAVVMLRI